MAGAVTAGALVYTVCCTETTGRERIGAAATFHSARSPAPDHRCSGKGATIAITMISPAHRSPLTRACRACLFALICVLLSASGHALTSAHSISLSTLGLAVGFCAAFAWSVADRQRGLLPITAGLLAGQGVLHLWFAAAPAGGYTGHAATTARPTATGTPAMVAAHCLAALLCGLWLWWGERTAFTLTAMLYTRIVLPLLLLVPPLPPTAAAVVARPPAELGIPATGVEFLRHAMARRGPPGGFPALSRIRRDTVTA